MPRIRSVRPETWSDTRFTGLTLPARYLYIALWTFADDEGRGRYNPKEIEGYAFPNDDLARWNTTIDKLLNELDRAGRIVIYSHKGQPYFSIPTFPKHQKPNKLTPSRIPEPPATKALPAPGGGTATPVPVTTPNVNPVLVILSKHFGAPERQETLDRYRSFTRHCLMEGGFQADEVGAQEVERRIINLKLAYPDNIRAWTINNLEKNWESYGVNKRPVSRQQVQGHIRKREVREALGDD